MASELDWFFRRDGSMFPVSYVSVPIDMPEGRGAVVAFSDIEDRLRAERILRDRDAILATEQDALRRVATLVAGGAASTEVFAAVAREVAHVLHLPLVEMSRYEPDGRATVIGAWSERPHPFQRGTRWALDGPTISAQPARIDNYAEVSGTIGDAPRRAGVHAAVGAPIVVDGRLWGVISAGGGNRVALDPNAEARLTEFTQLVAATISNTQAREDLRRLADEQAALRRIATLVAEGAESHVVVEGRVWGALIAGTDEPEPLPAGTEHRLASFAELIATAVANATARSALIASRARIAKAADEQRRRVVRDLHDGAQQRLVHAVMTLQLAHSHGDAPPALRRLVGEALEHARAAIDELRELARGIHPAILTHRGLAAAVEALADRAPLPVHVDIPERRYAPPVESAAYFIAAEALTNVAKYANASVARITATHSADRLVLTVEDDGTGGAIPSPDSPPGAGTRIRAEIPLTLQGSRESVAFTDAAPA